MRRIGLAVVLALSLTLAPLAAEGQQAGKVYRLGILTMSEASTFEQELRSLGYVEGGNILITRRYTHGSLEAAPRLATESSIPGLTSSSYRTARWRGPLRGPVRPCPSS
jgi:hypothetical protein